MPNPVFLIADPDPSRRAAILRRCDQQGRVTALGAATPGEAYTLIESHLPRRVAIAGEFADSVEFDALSDILTMIDAEVVIYGPTRHRGRHHPLYASAELMLAQMFGGQQALRAPAPAHVGRSVATGPQPVSSVIVLGASTGGITALETVLGAFGPDCPPTMIVQHIRPGFAEGLVRRLDALLAPRVVAAQDGALLQRGVIYLACASDRHLGLTLRGGPRSRLIAGPPVSGHCPSVDVLFADAAAVAARLEVRAALLTGMGADGANGLCAIRRAGGLTIAQDRDSSVVWGMPRVAVEMGAAVDVLPVSRIGQALTTREAPRSRRSS